MTTFEELLCDLGDVPAERIILDPAPGTATEADLVRHNDLRPTSVELVDGTLVEKAWRHPGHGLSMWLGFWIYKAFAANNVGVVYGTSCGFRLSARVVRVPDISVIRWENVATADDAVVAVAPDLAVEVWSKSNRKGEMVAQRGEYFAAGVRLVWEILPVKQLRRPTRSPTDVTELTGDANLDGGDVLPGLALPLRTIFDGPPRPTSVR